MNDLAQWLHAQLDEDALWATEASRYDGGVHDGGVHWQWECPDTDEVVTPDPGQEEFVGGEESFRVSLRSRETWPSRSVRELPQFAIPTAEEVPAAVGGHIIRHDPARVLREIDAKRRIVEQHRPVGYGGVCLSLCHTRAPGQPQTWPCLTLRLLALPYTGREGYRPEWAPTD